jgi:hypothetical protein
VVGDSKLRRRRVWHISPEGFRELRHTCLLSRKACAAYLGVSLRTVRHWDAGRNRVPWSAVRLLRLRRAGELGGLLDGWEGWTIWRDRLVSPDGRAYRERDMRHLWLTLTQASLFRESYDRATLGGVGAVAPADACAAVPLMAMPGRGADTLPASAAIPAPSHSRQTALDRVPAEPVGVASVGKAEGAAAGHVTGDPACVHAAGGGGRDAIMTPLCSHETADCGAARSACNMEQTAPVCGFPRLNLPRKEVVPSANRGLKAKVDANLTSPAELPCKGVA